ncbi:MAG TPA: tRNA guanosine(34) transglycosylase Tgt [Patescibacteria group bacterium]|nr:tRNA guanosine(34) transglycosylase Tgt [Patescibacteria group bacterium]
MSFKVIKTDKKSSARLGTLKTPHGEIQTPCFMPCGTLGTVKTTTPDELKELGVDILLGNTYHLYLRPGDTQIKKLGGLHEFMRWNGPILTDSGGYQVFSLGREKVKSSKLKVQSKNSKLKNENCDIENSLKIVNCKLKNNVKNLVKIREDGIEFQSHLDGSKHFFTPEKVIDIQKNLGSDIMMVLDECTPYPATKKYATEAMERTHNWALQALEYHKSKPSTLNPNPLLFGIIQGSTFKDLREKSAKYISSLPFDGIAIGGVAVGEGKQEMYKVINWVTDILHKNENLVVENIQYPISNIQSNSKSKKLGIGHWSLGITGHPRPVYLMGVGTPEDLLEGVERGIDMFDCVLPTRLARHGTVWVYDKKTKNQENKKTRNGKLNLLNSEFKNDKKVLMSGCGCYSCRNGFSRAYIHHLLKEGEVLGIRLTTLHNLNFLLDLMRKIRQNIDKGTFEQFKNAFLKNWDI